LILLVYYIDTNIFVYAVEKHPKYGRMCAKILSDLQEKKIQGTCSVLVLVELINVLTKLNKIISKEGANKLVIADNIAAVLSLPIIWIDLDISIIETASKYEYAVNGVDYVHIASMNGNTIDEILSADRDLDKVKAVKRIDPLDYK